MKDLLNRHSVVWADKTIRWRIFLSLFLLIVSIVFVYGSRIYTSAYTGDAVPDLLLDNLPIFDVSFAFFQGAFFFLIALLLILIYEPKYIPFTLESTAIFFIIRSFFTVMTHLSAPGQVTYQFIDYDQGIGQIVFSLSTGNDLFFSGHAGFPFLLALIFWNFPFKRYFFLLASLAGSIVVILGHIHYSIDVFSAYFIAYGIFEISKHIFKKEYALFHSDNRKTANI